MDLAYAVVGRTGDTLHIQVVADASGVLSELDADNAEQDGIGEVDDELTETP